MRRDLPPDLGYAGLTLDRMGERRHDGARLEAEAASAERLTALFHGDKAVFAVDRDGALALLFGRAGAEALGPREGVFLGRSAAGPVFAARVSDDLDEEALIARGFAVEDLRTVASDGRLAGEPLAIAGYAKSMLAWHALNGFCANCGARTEVEAGGARRACRSCGATHFPRVDPVVIMLATSGDRCLLGRQQRFPEGMWSCLAGFVEPGETVEEAARREILEEAGVTLGAIGYALSQPWPFPSQLMIGVVGEALDEALVIDRDELEDARWFTRHEVALMLARTHPAGCFAPPPAAIAHHLLRLFVER